MSQLKLGASKFMRRQTRFPGGIATGGGETNFYWQPQEHMFTVALFGAGGSFRDVLLPKGFILTYTIVIPFNGNDAPGSGLDGVPATGGTVAIDQWSNVSPPAGPGGGSSLASLLASTPATAYLKTAVGSPSIAATEQRIRFRALTTITPFVAGGQGNGAVLVGLGLIMPRMRP